MLTGDRQCSCSHISALIILLANIIVYPTSDSNWADLQTSITTLGVLEKIFDVVQSPAYSPLRHVVDDLYQSATKVVNEAHLQSLSESDDAIVAAAGMGMLDGQFMIPLEYNDGQLVGFEDGMFDIA